VKNLSLIFIAVALAVVVLGSSGKARAQTNGSAAYTGDVENGKRLFVADGCYQCHNYNGSGGRAGARLSQTKLTAAGLIAYVRKPRTMPAYSTKVLSDQEATDLWAYIKTFPEPPPVKSIPLLNLD
jgi:mono/diheme cytochrome c family protein